MAVKRSGNKRTAQLRKQKSLRKQKTMRTKKSLRKQKTMRTKKSMRQKKNVNNATENFIKFLLLKRNSARRTKKHNQRGGQ